MDIPLPGNSPTEAAKWTLKENLTLDERLIQMNNKVLSNAILGARYSERAGQRVQQEQEATASQPWQSRS